MAALASDWSRHFYFSRTTACEVSILCRNIPLGVLLLFRTIENPKWPPWLWLIETFLIYVLKPSLLEVTRHGRCVRLSALKSFWRSVVTFWSVPKSKMAVLVFNWPRHVLLIFQENSIQILQKCSSRDPFFVLHI